MSGVLRGNCCEIFHNILYEKFFDKTNAFSERLQHLLINKIKDIC